MKTIYFVLTWSVFLNVPFSLFASDTLFVKTNKGSYLFDVKNKKLQPIFDASLYNILFSTEGLGHCTISKRYNVNYVYTKEEEYDWWSVSLEGDQESFEVVNFDTKPKDSGYILYPLSWNKNYSSLYFFSTNGDALNNEKGIYEYNISKKKLILRIPQFSYSNVPLVNDSRTTLYFIRENKYGQSIVSFDMKNNTEKVLLSSLSVIRFGILSSVVQSNSLLNCATDSNQLDLNSPFQNQVGFCVTRMGFEDVLSCVNACPYELPLCSELPYCEGHCSAGCTNCRDAVDMDVLVDTENNKLIFASSYGYVVRAQEACPQQGMGQGYGFGYHVVLRHGNQNDSNAPETLYAHLQEIFVQEGEYVYVGDLIGTMGNSQVIDCNQDGILDCDCENSTGEHVHYEYHSGNGSLYSTSDICAPVFEDIGSCIPQPNNSYTTSNDVSFDIEECTPVASDYSIDSVFSVCDGTVHIAISSEVCEYCISSWQSWSFIVTEDIFEYVITEQMLSQNNDIYMLHAVYSNCLPLSSMEVVFIPINPELFDYSCIETVPCFILDLNQDQFVNGADLMILNGVFGLNQSFGDFDQNGVVGTGDFLILISQFGEFCDE